MITAPLVLQQLFLAQGRTSRANAELALQDYYFWFLFLQVFLVISVSSSVATVLSSLKYDVRSFTGLVALNLPKAANYFLSYVVLQSFSVSAGTLLQVGRLTHFIAGPLLGNTARDVWERLKKPQVQWGMFFPVYTNLAVITIIYSVAVQRYNVLHVATFNTDTGGLAYIKGLFLLFLGLYFLEVYLVGLFFLVRDEKGKPACIGQGIAMVASIASTAVYHMFLKRAYEPLISTVPVMLSSGTIGNVPKNEDTAPRTWFEKFRQDVERLHRAMYKFVEEDVSPLESYEQAEQLAKNME
ncbi:MAG: hypothetical protein Q9210_007186 [Variospora velana]